MERPAARFDGRLVLVTGGGTGIGAAIARRFADEGAEVTITGRRESVLAASGLHFVVADIATDSGRDTLLAALPEVDVLVNNAGTISDSWAESGLIHVEAPRALTERYAPSLAARGGSVVNVASIGGLAAAPGAAAYSASKAAEIMLTRTMAVELGPRGVRVNSVSPGWVRSPMADDEMEPLMRRHSTDLEGAYGIVTRFLPLRRVAEASEIAGVVAFLASADASFMTGANIVVDGGSMVVDVGMLAFDEGP